MANTSSKNVYNFAEETRRTKIELGKLFSEQMKVNFFLHKDVTERDLLRHQLKALFTSYNLNNRGNKGKKPYAQQSFTTFS